MNKLSKDDSEMIKGIAALFVIIAHYSQWYITQAASGIVWMLLTKLGRYGVAIFFAVSGYGLVCSACKGIDKGFLKRRVLNVYLPYVLISGIIRLFDKDSWKLKDIFLWLSGGETWFVFVIMLFYFIFYLGYKYCRHKVLSIETGIALASVLLAFYFKDDVWYASNISFGAGILIKVYEDKISSFPRGIFAILFGGGFVVCAVIYMMAMNQNQAVYLLFKILASAFWAILVLGILIQFDITKIHMFQAIGKGSLECYLIHGFILNVFKTLELEPIFIVCISLLITLICAYGISSIWERIRTKNRVV